MRIAIATAALAAALALPGVAQAEKETVVVPPSNSAATQYTETFPTSGGNAEVGGGHGGGSGRGGSSGGGVSRQTSQALQEEGAAGHAVERLVEESPAGSSGAGGSAPRQPQGSGSGGHGSGSTGGGSGNGSGGSGAHGATVSQPSGASGAGEVVSHGTLTSSGGMGVFLPLILLAALVGAAVYAWRRRHRQTPPPGTPA